MLDNTPHTFLDKKSEFVRCPDCTATFEGITARFKASLHFAAEHTSRLKNGDVTTSRAVITVLGKRELRLNQRVLLAYASVNTFFALTDGPDSVSAHSLSRLGLLARCGDDATPMRERYWHITVSGRILHEAYTRRYGEVEKRERITRRRRPR